MRLAGEHICGLVLTVLKASPFHVQVVTPPSSAATAPALQEIIADFGSAGSQAERMQLLLQYASSLPHMPEDAKSTANRVMGCTAQARCAPCDTLSPKT